MQYIKLPLDQAQAVLAYLERCPYRDVANGVMFLAMAMQNPITEPDQPKVAPPPEPASPTEG